MRKTPTINIDSSTEPSLSFSAKGLLAIILLEGFVSISVEIITIRQLIPFVGNSVTVTSLIIGIFLFFLAYGYKRGGTHEAHFGAILNRNFLIAAFFLGVGLSYPFIELFFFAFSRFSTHLLFALCGYLLLILAPLIYVLGQTVPITMNLMKKAPTVGAIGGNVLQLSTLGSFLGAILTSLILFNFLGVAWTIFINFLILFILVIYLNFHKGLFNVSVLIVLSMALVVFSLNNRFESLTFLHTNSFSNLQVKRPAEPERHLPSRKWLVINNSLSSAIDARKTGLRYIEKIKTMLFDELKIRQKEILVLGAGGFTLSAENPYQNHFTYVDIDKDLPDIVKKYFLNPIHGTFIAKDARHYLLSTTLQYDVILVDVYSNRHEIPAHLLTQEFFHLVKSHIREGGLAVFNIIGSPMLSDPYSKRIDNTLRRIFDRCMVVPISYTDQLNNLIYACHILNDQDHSVYSDNLNPSDLDLHQKASP